MKTIRFVKNPGYTFDLFFLFTLYFNKEYCLAKFINGNKSAEDTKHFKKMLADFGPVPDNLLLFFHLGKHPRTWMSTYYFQPYKEDFLRGTYSLETVQQALMDYDQVIEDVLAYYFEDTPEETRNACRHSAALANQLIRQSGYDNHVKSALYSFLIDPIPIIQRLSYELMAKEFIVAKQYEQNLTLLNDIRENLDPEFLSYALKNCVKDVIDVDSFDQMFISFCPHHKNLIKIFYFPKKGILLLLLGTDYIDLLQYLNDLQTIPNLREFGQVISEDTRIAMLELMYEKGEVTLRQFEQELDLAGTNAYYHVTMMSKAGMLRTRNEGRKILYSLNPEYFEPVGKTIIHFSQANEKRNP